MLYSTIHVGSCWKIQDRRQIIKKTDNTETKHNHRNANNTKHSKHKTTLVQSPFTTLDQETRWAYSTNIQELFLQTSVTQRDSSLETTWQNCVMPECMLM